MVGKRHLAAEAIFIEQKVIGENVGSQDQVAASFGGLNRIEFNAQEDFTVQPVTIGQRKTTELQNHLMLFFTGFSRTASEIAAEQIKNTTSKAAELRAMHQMVDEAAGILSSPTSGIEDFGRLLHESWRLKRTLSTRITTSAIDQMYEAAIGAGAIGGKLCGAGGGGFLLLFVPPRRRRLVQRALHDLLYVPFQFETLGSQISYYADEGPYLDHRTTGTFVEVAASRARPLEPVEAM
jgi:D-glycero-alpha-D-manno-heptose-7-phosphate kinase